MRLETEREERESGVRAPGGCVDAWRVARAACGARGVVGALLLTPPVAVPSARALSQTGACDAAFAVWQQLRTDGRTVPNVRTFTELISACCKAGALDAAFGVLYQMLAEGIEPSRVTFDIMLRASCVANAPNRFFELKSMITSTNMAVSRE